ncbi:MAG TPA: universal stress protein, partial [Thermoanaerobaculia bacterium]|nr:universal stress protein [Thermoanaerobaculia bacterium]
ETVSGWLHHAGGGAWLLWITVVPLAVGVLALLAYVTVQPLVERRRGARLPAVVDVHGSREPPIVVPAPLPRRIACAVDFSAADAAVLGYAAGVLRENDEGKERKGPRGKVVLLHVVESGGARVMGEELADRERRGDEARLERYADELRALGVDATWDLGFGDPATALGDLVETHRPDLVILGSHGHGALGDLFLGTSVERLRHRVKVPVVVVPVGAA